MVCSNLSGYRSPKTAPIASKPTNGIAATYTSDDDEDDDDEEVEEGDAPLIETIRKEEGCVRAAGCRPPVRHDDGETFVVGKGSDDDAIENAIIPARPVSLLSLYSMGVLL